jgi:sugar lactone lactonase YvrE
MELVEGRTLEDESRERGPLSPEEVAQIGVEVCRALGAVHAAGLLHRDVKAQNVMREARAGRIVLMDFSAGRELGERETENATMPVSVVGSPLYIAPEILSGQPATPRSDLYSLGVLLFWLLTGTYPVVGRSLRDIGDAHRAGVRTWVSAARPDVRSDLANAIDRALSVCPADRFRDARDMEQALGASLPGGTAERAARRRGWVRAVTVLGALASAAAIAGPYIGDPREQGAVAAHQAVFARLTANPSERLVTSAVLSPAGDFVAYADPTGIHVRSTISGDTRRLPETRGMEVYAWTRDREVVRAVACDREGCADCDIDVRDGRRRCSGARWPLGDRVRATRDGSRLVRVHADAGITVDFSDGSPPRELLSGVRVRAAAWSPDGGWLYVARADRRSVERLALDDRPPVAVFTPAEDEEVADVVAVTGGRLVVVISERARVADPSPENDVTIWMVTADPGGTGSAPPRRLADWHGDLVALANTSADGTRVVFLRSTVQTDVYLAAFDPEVGLTDVPRRLTDDERNDYATSWAPDGATVFLTTTRRGPMDIFTQPIDSDTAEPFVVEPGDQVVARVAGDTGWVLYHEWIGPQIRRIMRVRVDGGRPELVYTLHGLGVVHCVASGRCVLLRQDGHEMLVSSLNPTHGVGQTLARIPLEISGAGLLPDGSGIAVILPAEAGRHNRIALVRFDAGPSRSFTVEGARDLVHLDWLPHGEGFFSVETTAGRDGWLYIRPDGRSKVLWTRAGLKPGPIIPSPDGRQLAINADAVQSNAWLLTSF